MLTRIMNNTSREFTSLGGRSCRIAHFPARASRVVVFFFFSNLAQRKLRYFECGSPERFVKTSAQTGLLREKTEQRTEIALFARRSPAGVTITAEARRGETRFMSARIKDFLIADRSARSAADEDNFSR